MIAGQWNIVTEMRRSRVIRSHYAKCIRMSTQERERERERDRERENALKPASIQIVDDKCEYYTE